MIHKSVSSLTTLTEPLSSWTQWVLLYLHIIQCSNTFYVGTLTYNNISAHCCNCFLRFLQVDVPDNLKSAILPCVWPLALTSNNQTEIDVWFDHRLSQYLKFLNKDILGSKDTLSASCLSYRKMWVQMATVKFVCSEV